MAGHRETSLEQRDTIEYRHLGTLLNLCVIVQHVFEPCAPQPLRLCNMKSSRSCVVCPPVPLMHRSSPHSSRNHTATHLCGRRIRATSSKGERTAGGYSRNLVNINLRSVIRHLDGSRLDECPEGKDKDKDDYQRQNQSPATQHIFYDQTTEGEGGKATGQ